VRERPETPRVPIVDEVVALRLQRLIVEHPTFGSRRLWAVLRFHEGLRINRKAVYRVLEGRFVHQAADNAAATRPGPTESGEPQQPALGRWRSPTSTAAAMGGRTSRR
jgi:hypothetical protein